MSFVTLFLASFSYVNLLHMRHLFSYGRMGIEGTKYKNHELLVIF
jgi:hypothetical protein